MYIKKNSLGGGCNVYLAMESGKGKEIGMDVCLIVLEKAKPIRCSSRRRKRRCCVFRRVGLAGGRRIQKRFPQKRFTEEASCLHVSAGTK